MKQTSERFNRAIEKLYNAFHNGTLDANDCKKCCIGNLCDGDGSWRHIVKRHGLGRLQHPHMPCFELGVDTIRITGYSPKEIVTIEKIFLDATGLNEDFLNCIENNVDKGIYTGSQEQNFKGLCAVVEYLCELEGISNIMDYTCLFESNGNEAKYKLESVV